MNDKRLQWRLERISRKITITEIANYLKVTSSYICAHELSRNTLSGSLYAKYCNYISTHDNNN